MKIKDIKEIIERLDKELDEMNERRNKWTKKEEINFNYKNEVRYSFAMMLKNEQLKSKVKRLEKQLKEMKEGK